MLGGPTATARSLSPAEALGRVTGQSVSRSTASASVAPVMTVGQADAPALCIGPDAVNAAAMAGAHIDVDGVQSEFSLLAPMLLARPSS